jgi:hypothetical protein
MPGRRRATAYLIDDEGITMAEAAGTFVVPTMQLTVADKGCPRRVSRTASYTTTVGAPSANTLVPMTDSFMADAVVAPVRPERDG